MADLHIEDFYRDCGAILLQLYSLFPRPQVLYVDSICGPDDPDEFGLPSPRFAACFSTMVWLGDIGLLRYTERLRHEALEQAVLSERGFLLLSTHSPMPWLTPAPDPDQLPPLLAQEALSHVSQLRRALASKASSYIGPTVQHLLEQARRFG